MKREGQNVKKTQRKTECLIENNPTEVFNNILLTLSTWPDSVLHQTLGIILPSYTLGSPVIKLLW